MTDPETNAAFVSHTSEDRRVAEELVQLLEARGLKCWIAYRDISALTDYVQQINDGIRCSRCVVLLYSEAANRSQNVRSELEIAWRQKKPIYTVKLEDVPLSETIAYYVQFTQWIDAWEGPFADHVDLLRRTLQSPARGVVGALRPASLGERLGRFGRRNLTALIAIVAIVAVAMFAVVRLGNVTDRIPLPPKAKLVTEIARDDLMIRGTVLPVGTESRYMIVLTPCDQGLYLTLMSAQVTYSVDSAPFQPGSSLTYTFTAQKPPKQVAVKIEGPNGEAGPFTYDLDFPQQVQSQLRQAGAQGGWLSCRRGFHGGISVCTPARALRAGAGVRLHLGTSVSELGLLIDLEDPRKNKGVAYSSEGGRQEGPTYLVPLKEEELWVQAEFSDGTRSEAVALGSGRSNDREPLFQLVADSTDAPGLIAALMSDHQLYKDGGLWSLYPIVGEEVRQVTWTIHEGGANGSEKYQGFFVVSQKRGSELGATIAFNGSDAPEIQITYEYADGTTNSYRYRADWSAWAWSIARSSLAFDKLVACRRSGETYYDASIAADCFLEIKLPPSRVFREIRWGMAPEALAPLERFDVAPLIQRFKDVQDAYYAKHPDEVDRWDTKRQNARNSFEYHLRDRFKNWRELGGGGLIFAVTSPVDAIYVKFILVDGTESSVVRVPIG